MRNRVVACLHQRKVEIVVLVSVAIYVIWVGSVCLVAETVRRALKNTHPLSARR